MSIKIGDKYVSIKNLKEHKVLTVENIDYRYVDFVERKKYSYCISVFEELIKATKLHKILFGYGKE